MPKPEVGVKEAEEDDSDISSLDDEEENDGTEEDVSQGETVSQYRLLPDLKFSLSIHHTHTHTHVFCFQQVLPLRLSQKPKLNRTSKDKTMIPTKAFSLQYWLSSLDDTLLIIATVIALYKRCQTTSLFCFVKFSVGQLMRQLKCSFGLSKISIKIQFLFNSYVYCISQVLSEFLVSLRFNYIHHLWQVL